MNEHKDQQTQSKGPDEGGRPHQGSYLFEGFMLWLLPVVLGLAIWFRLVPLIILATCLLVTALVVMFWKKNALKHVQPSIKLSTNRVFAGHSVKLSMSVANNKWLPLVWLEWEQAQQKGITWPSQEKGPYIIRLLWLLWYQNIEWELEGKAKRRGVYELGQLTLRSGDAFRFSEQERQYRLPASLYVYPKLLAVSVPNLRATQAWEMRGANGGFLEDPLLVDGLREYQSGDEWRRIDWRATSKTGVLQTRVFTKIITQHIQLVIDVQGFRKLAQLEQAEQNPNQHPEQEQYNEPDSEQFEWLLSVVASVAVSYQEQKVWVGLTSNALDHQGKRMEALAPAAELTPCLDQLAKLSIRPAFGSERLLEGLLIDQARYRPIYYFCQSISEEHLHFWQTHNQELPYLRFYYVEETDQVRKIGGAARPVDALIAEYAKKGANL